MANLINPQLFSVHFGISPNVLDAAGFIDPILNCDTKLFIDPVLLTASSNAKVSNDAHALLRERFSDIIRLLDVSESVGDVAWRNASRRLNLDERFETCLGYGGSGIGGSSRPDDLRQTILATAKEILVLGKKDPEILSLMGMFEDGVGPDTISDLTTNAILPVLCELTEEFSSQNNIPVKVFPAYSNKKLPENPYRLGSPIVLVPRDIVRELPIAADWSDVIPVVRQIAAVRDTFNALIGNISKATLSEKKHALKVAALQSLSNFEALFQTVLASTEFYDPNQDVLNFYTLRQIMVSDLQAFKTNIAPVGRKDSSELKRIVDAIIQHFKFLVENNNLWELVWNEDRPKRERASQLLFFGVADAFCKANNIDISPETNMGGGPVDFKFSSGYEGRVLVEVKLSKGAVVSGYERQLEIYKDASNTKIAVFLIMNVGGIGNKLVKIKKIQADLITNNQQASDIVVVEAGRKVSASKA